MSKVTPNGTYLYFGIKTYLKSHLFKDDNLSYNLHTGNPSGLWTANSSYGFLAQLLIKFQYQKSLLSSNNLLWLIEYVATGSHKMPQNCIKGTDSKSAEAPKFLNQF